MVFFSGMQTYDLSVLPVLISKYLEASDIIKMVDKGTFSTVALTDPEKAGITRDTGLL